MPPLGVMGLEVSSPAYLDGNGCNLREEKPMPQAMERKNSNYSGLYLGRSLKE
jgi:hypothetical protein